AGISGKDRVGMGAGVGIDAYHVGVDVCDDGACQMVCVSRTERNGTIMTMTNEKQQHDDGPSGQDLVEQLKASGQLDALFEQIDAGQVELTGDGGFVPALVKAALERGLQAELSSHLGYEKGSGEASKHANSRNGSTPKT